MDIHDWFLTLPEGEQKILREDRWMLASRAWEAALTFGKEPVAEVPCSALLDPAHVAKAIDDEPECPGEMPEEMWQALKVMGETNDRAGMTEDIRLTVRLTKEGIKERLGV